MLKVLFGKRTEDAIVPPDYYFNNTYDNRWFMKEDKNIVQMVKDIDKCDLVGMNVLSPIFGSLSIKELSGGVKGLIMLYKDNDFTTDLIVFGENCEDWLLKIANMKDIEVCMTGVDMRFEGRDDLKAWCLNDNTEINGWKEWTRKMIDLV